MRVYFLPIATFSYLKTYLVTHVCGLTDFRYVIIGLSLKSVMESFPDRRFLSPIDTFVLLHHTRKLYHHGNTRYTAITYEMRLWESHTVNFKQKVDPKPVFCIAG